MARSSRDKITEKKPFHNLPRDPFFHTMDFVSTKEIFTKLRHVNKEWNKFTKEELTLKKFAERCEEHPQHKNPKSFLSYMLISIDTPSREAVSNYLCHNGIPPQKCAGFRGLANWLDYTKDDINRNMPWFSFNTEIVKRFYPHLSKKEMEKMGGNFHAQFHENLNLYKRFKNKEKLREKEYIALYNLFQLCEDLSKIMMDIAIVSMGSNFASPEGATGPTNESCEATRMLLTRAPLHDMTSHALIVLMNIINPTLFPLGLEDPALKPHLSKLNSEELDFVKKYNAGNWKKPTEEFKSETPTSPLKESHSSCRIM